ncbi:DUF3861 domain-containing protein [Vibrio tritonius]|uniref:DUF3861 domain-containing protein n=1 Tax=Vibrio tritonius TaxID=1435069 RepID=A0ABS7YMD8_9VIBR|nr:DUF3861 family protein [Vibrio tritonius]MCA2016831.1 DUF3861 domain-containing protein [Vibrio tritonius]
MKKYLYRVDITPVTDKEGNEPTNPQSIAFDFPCHDELHGLLAKVGVIEDLTEQESLNLLMGIKMMGEVMLEHRNHTLFKDLNRPFGEFMRAFKQQVAQQEK